MDGAGGRGPPAPFNRAALAGRGSVRVAILSIGFPDLLTILAACRTVRAADCVPGALRAHLVARLATPYPRLAARVRGFDGAQMAALAHYVLDGLELAEGPPTAHRP